MIEKNEIKNFKIRGAHASRFCGVVMTWILFFIVIAGTRESFADGTDAGFDKYQLLIKRNPFLPKPDAKPVAPKKTNNGQYRFVGFSRYGENIRVTIEASNKSYSLESGQQKDGILVKEINLKDRSVIIEAAGESLSLGLESIPIIAAMAPPGSPGNPLQPAGTSGGVQASVTAPTTGTEGSTTNTPNAQPPRRRIVTPKR